MIPYTTHPEKFTWSNFKGEIIDLFMHALLLAAIIAIALLLGSCGTSKQIAVVDRVQHDTLYINKIQYDSIYQNDSFLMDYHPSKEYIYLFDSILVMKVDTMYIRDKQVQYKYRFLRDTTYIHKVDTIPVIQQVEVVKMQKYTPWYAKTFAWIGVICLLLFAIWLSFKLVIKR